ncbi:MAG: alcohol dehydrogenase catalytic domain-containing protein [Clostridia bacterium]|nr:alcohol dehydrogenase catalytic domain-containing protein [Clostridia bacterium]
MKTKAAVFTGAEKPFEIREFEVTKTPSGYGQSELIVSGVCGTDIHIHRGKLQVFSPAIIGHEFVGRLIDCDEAEAEKYGLKKGDTVIADIAVPCGECPLCKSGDDANCVNLKTTNEVSIEEAPYLFGGYAGINYTPLANLIKVPDELDPRAAAVFACPGPTVIHSLSLAGRAGIKVDGDTVAVVQGLGPVGLFAVTYLKKLGVKKLYVITRRENEKREELSKKLGADRVFSIEKDGITEIKSFLQAQNGGIGVDLCIETSGAPSAIPVGMDILRNRGVYLIPGQYSDSGAVEIHPELITFKALQIFGSSQYSIPDVKAYLEFLKNNTDLQDTIVKLGTYYHISEVNEAFSDAKAGKNIKTMLIL